MVTVEHNIVVLLFILFIYSENCRQRQQLGLYGPSNLATLMTSGIGLGGGRHESAVVHGHNYAISFLLSTFYLLNLSREMP